MPDNSITDVVQVILDGSGNGTAAMSPGQVAPGRSGGVGAGRNSGYTWDVTGIAVGASTHANDAICSVYVSYGIKSAGPGDFQGKTLNGSSGDTDSVALTIRPGDWITAVWQGGDPGAIATLRPLGTVNIPGVT